MVRLHHIIPVLAGTCTVYAAAVPRASKPSPKNPFTNDFEKLVKQAMADWNVPGLSIAVVDDHNVFSTVSRHYSALTPCTHAHTRTHTHLAYSLTSISLIPISHIHISLTLTQRVPTHTPHTLTSHYTHYTIHTAHMLQYTHYDKHITRIAHISHIAFNYTFHLCYALHALLQSSLLKPHHHYHLHALTISGLRIRHPARRQGDAGHPLLCRFNHKGPNGRRPLQLDQLQEPLPP